MSHVVVLEHIGVRCAIPAAQVVRGQRAAEEPEIRLWDGAARRPAGERTLVVDTPLGARRLSCADARFVWLDEEPMVELPELLREALRLPHVVGVSESGDALLWLVDLHRWEEG